MTFEHIVNTRQMKTASKNRFLIVGKGVILTPITEAVIIALDPYFEAQGKVAHVTSCVRSQESQLSTIRGYLAKTGMDKKYPEAMICKVNDRSGDTYVWQKGWSALLNAGIIINPPKKAAVLMEYKGSDGSIRKIGHVVPASGHIPEDEKDIVKCFDIGGGTDGIDGNVVSEQKIVHSALADKLAGLKSIVLERKNNCVHVECSAL